MQESRKGPLRANQLTFEHLTREEEPQAQCGYKSPTRLTTTGACYQRRPMISMGSTQPSCADLTFPGTCSTSGGKDA
jgi:hypothetical protein